MTAPGSLQAFTRRFGAKLVAAPALAAHPTSPRRGGVIATLKPATIRHVSAMLAYCQEHAIPVHPVSGGTNWGYGARVPWSERDAVLLDLRALDSIVAYDATFGILRVQPGVTFAAAHAFLGEQPGVPFVMNPTGGSPQGSVLANALERGHGSGYYTDRFTALRRLRVILPDGSETTTDFSEGGGVGAHRWGQGPNLRGLFSQSSLGVVVEADCLLSPRPKYSEGLTAWFFDPKLVIPVVDRIREHRCMLHLAIRGGHRLYAASVHGDPERTWPVRTERVGYPVSIAFGYEADDPDALRVLRKQAFAILRGSGGQVEVASSWPGIRNATRSGLPAKVHAAYESDLYTHRITERSIRSAYRVRTPKEPQRPLDLDRDAVGLIWATPAVPMVGAEVSALIDDLERIALAHDVEPDVTLISIDDWRFLDGIFGFLFDATRPKKLAAAERAFREFDVLARKRGYPTYRSGIQHQAKHMVPTSRAALLSRLKSALDPNGILSPWRLP